MVNYYDILFSFAQENNLSPFENKKLLASALKNFFLTRDSKYIHQKVLTILSQFNFSESKLLWECFLSSCSLESLAAKQDFFKSLISSYNFDFLHSLKISPTYWRPSYSFVVATEDESTFSSLKEKKIPCTLIINQWDLESLKDYDVVQVLDCDTYAYPLEELDNVIIINSIDSAYLEQYLSSLSSWEEIIDLFIAHKNSFEDLPFSVDFEKILILLKDLLFFTSNDATGVNSLDEVETECSRCNAELSSSLKQLTLSGDVLFGIMSNQKLPPDVDGLIKDIIAKSSLPFDYFIPGVPLKLDYEFIKTSLAKQDAEVFVSHSQNLLKHASDLLKIPEYLKEISSYILIMDFISGVSKYLSLENLFYPQIGTSLKIDSGINLFLAHADPISFLLDPSARCSILTGANSGGKTTLLEHVLQLCSLSLLGLPTVGLKEIPFFDEIYYFAKNKGSANKGAFETLLTQMSKISDQKKTLILADEIESVTEPGVAGKIIAATAHYFIDKGAYLIIATHLGQDIKPHLPPFSRIDGIEAKGLDESYNLIIDHNPVLGRLAHSTPELIVEKMANTKRSKYLSYLYDFMKK